MEKFAVLTDRDAYHLQVQSLCAKAMCSYLQKHLRVRVLYLGINLLFGEWRYNYYELKVHAKLGMSNM